MEITHRFKKAIVPLFGSSCLVRVPLILLFYLLPRRLSGAFSRLLRDTHSLDIIVLSGSNLEAHAIATLHNTNSSLCVSERKVCCFRQANVGVDARMNAETRE